MKIAGVLLYPSLMTDVWGHNELSFSRYESVIPIIFRRHFVSCPAIRQRSPCGEPDNAGGFAWNRSHHKLDYKVLSIWSEYLKMQMPSYPVCSRQGSLIFYISVLSILCIYSRELVSTKPSRVLNNSERPEYTVKSLKLKIWNSWISTCSNRNCVRVQFVFMLYGAIFCDRNQRMSLYCSFKLFKSTALFDHLNKLWSVLLFENL